MKELGDQVEAEDRGSSRLRIVEDPMAERLTVVGEVGHRIEPEFDRRGRARRGVGVDLPAQRGERLGQHVAMGDKERHPLDGRSIPVGEGRVEAIGDELAVADERQLRLVARRETDALDLRRLAGVDRAVVPDHTLSDGCHGVARVHVGHGGGRVLVRHVRQRLDDDRLLERRGIVAHDVLMADRLDVGERALEQLVVLDASVDDIGTDDHPGQIALVESEENRLARVRNDLLELPADHRVDEDEVLVQTVLIQDDGAHVNGPDIVIEGQVELGDAQAIDAGDHGVLEDTGAVE